ncbi:hypothetical protein [Altererythrobacter aquiaggeris]|uniref:hypothetical protein n=1 Tax=Aestuarierythrobacter aquiaggeris TaxID=1898396 RepID=UPI003019C4ED
MLELFLSGILGFASVGGSQVACPDVDAASDDHLMGVCSPLVTEYPAYSVTYRASLSPQPASQQVMIYGRDDGWMLSIVGYRWTPGSEVILTRRQKIAISNDDAQRLSNRLTEASMKQLLALPYYGPGDQICTDGATNEVAMSKGGKKVIAQQHSCAGKTLINEISAAFRELALEYDPEFEGLLSGLEN